MATSVGIRGNNNNPGDLTVNKVGQMLYPGQTGTTAKNPVSGLIYATFDTMQAGYDALVDYAKRHVTSSGWDTPNEYVGGYLNGDPSKLASTSANPYPQSYLSTFDKYGGFTSGQTLTAADANNIAIGVVHAEGNTSALSQINTGSNTGNLTGAVQNAGSSFQLGLDTLVHDPATFAATYGSVLSAGATGIVTNPAGAAGVIANTTSNGAATVAGAAADASGLTGLTKLLATALSPETIERAVLVILGLLLLAAGLFALTRPQGQNVSLSDIPKLAAVAA